MGRVDVVRFPYWWPTSTQRLTPNMRQQMRRSLLAKIQIPAFLLASVLSLRTLVERHKVDVVNAHWLVPQGFVAALVRGRRKPRFRLVLHVHAGDVYLLAKLPGGRMLAKFVLRRSDHVFADGSHVRDTLDALIRAASGAQLQPMGVNVSAFRSDVCSESGLETSSVEAAPEVLSSFSDGFILFVGRLVEKKGVIYLIRALPAVLRRFPRMGLAVMGAGPDEHLLKAEVSKLGLTTSVRFLGHQSHGELSLWLRGCRVAAVPSIVDQYGETEGMPTVVLEALASGVRVVGSAVDGIPDVIRHGENGWLCQPKDPADLADKLLDALGDRAPSTVLLAAADTAEQFDWPNLARRYAEALRG